MQRNTLSFKVSKAVLTANSRYLLVTYTEPDASNSGPFETRISAEAFEHFLKCLHDVDCPTLIEYITHAPTADLFQKVAAWMENMMWEAHYESTYYRDAA